MANIYEPVASFKTTITSRITSTDTTIDIDNVQDDTGTNLSGTFAFVIDEGTVDEETVVGTIDAANSRLTSCLRGLSPVNGASEVTALKKAHRKKATIKITDHPYLVLAIRRLNGTDQLGSAATPMAYSSAPTLTPGSNQFATVAYADALAIAGAPDGSETTKGLYEAATYAEVAAGDDSGTTTAPTVVRPSKLAAVIQAGSYLYAVEDGTGADDAYTAELVPAITAYTTGQIVAIKFTVANTGAATLALNAIASPRTIKKYAAGALADLETGDIVAAQTMLLLNDGTYFVLLNPCGGMPTSALLTEMSTFFTNTDITGAEAETLTAGPTSDADAKHTHNNIPTGHTLVVTYPGPDAGNPARGCGYSYEAGVERITIGNDDGIRTVFRVATEAGTSLYPDIGPSLVAAIASCANILYADGHTWCAAAAGGTTANQDGSGVTFASQACSGAMGWDDGNSYLMFHNTTTNIRRFTYAGTTLTFVDNITLGSACDTDLGWVFDDVNNMLYFIDTTDSVIRKFNTSGVLQSSTAYTSINPSSSTIIGIVAVDGRIHIAIRAGHGESSATASIDLSVCSAMLVPTSVTF